MIRTHVTIIFTLMHSHTLKCPFQPLDECRCTADFEYPLSSIGDEKVADFFTFATGVMGLFSWLFKVDVLLNS